MKNLSDIPNEEGFLFLPNEEGFLFLGIFLSGARRYCKVGKDAGELHRAYLIGTNVPIFHLLEGWERIQQTPSPMGFMLPPCCELCFCPLDMPGVGTSFAKGCSACGMLHETLSTLPDYKNNLRSLCDLVLHHWTAQVAAHPHSILPEPYFVQLARKYLLQMQNVLPS